MSAFTVYVAIAILTFVGGNVVLSYRYGFWSVEDVLGIFFLAFFWPLTLLAKMSISLGRAARRSRRRDQ
jgi:hypothetical protein